MNFRRRSCPCQPKSQLIEDVSDDRRIFDETDDPHCPLTFWAWLSRRPWMYKRPSPLDPGTAFFPGRRRPDDIAGQVLHRPIISGRDTIAAEDVEAGMPPCREHGDRLLRDPSFVQKHPEHLVPENGLQLPIVQEVAAEDFRDAEDEMTVRNLLEDIHAQPLPEFHHAFLMA